VEHQGDVLQGDVIILQETEGENTKLLVMLDYYQMQTIRVMERRYGLLRLEDQRVGIGDVMLVVLMQMDVETNMVNIQDIVILLKLQDL
jgi:thioesterase domain-containing protein